MVASCRAQGIHTQRVLGVRCEDGPLGVNALSPSCVLLKFDGFSTSIIIFGELGRFAPIHSQMKFNLARVDAVFYFVYGEFAGESLCMEKKSRQKT